MTSRQKLFTLGATTTVVAAALALTGCGAGSKDSADGAAASPAAKGAVTEAQAAKILGTYESVNNKANAQQDSALLGTVEGGQLYEQSKADYRLFETRSKKEQAEYRKPFHYTGMKYWIPAGKDWFAVTTKASDSKSEALLVFGKEYDDWKMMSAVYSEVPLPAIATDDSGLATAVDATTRVGTLAPNQISAAFEDLYATGGTKAGAGISHTTEAAKDAIETYAKRDSGKNAKFATTAYVTTPTEFDTVYALRLKDGGVLAALPTAHASQYGLKASYRENYDITPTEVESVFNIRDRDTVVNTYQGMALATLPKTGKPSVTAIEYRIVDSQ
ncbi:hypothetical protein ACKI1I_00810 [Streptomyces turgidiscabies]|uniref:Putative lipoprotein n=1 Tax=Streptomyces turgidiscabies (strain Car8) TaxID=698760 RepID=L7FIT2_STRT8|nr:MULTISPECIES: hypothetical protein [Streptomyces]ELP71237.1 putative lipoprotein [Streptomyces turgidiscabies Car8]MDX3492562.1 hypothetical protein [Streptomyces turgidiscabies]GAQ69141.1 hypothetical protein T45_00863 [Streptomyces turgidiscabies]